MTDAVGVRQTRVQLRAAFPHQPGQPVPRERPKIVTPTAAPGADLPAETRIVGIDRVGARGEFSNPDRKSTRLNSSHVRISYAVFCLQKKTPLAPSSPTLD